MSTGHKVTHDYHLIDPSIWPLLSSFAGGLFAVGMVLFMHEVTAWLLPVGVLSILVCMAGWWGEVVDEAVRQKAHTAVVRVGLRYGMVLFIASEVMFFVAFFWAFFDASLFPKEAINFVWPPANITTFDAFDLPLLNTLILLLSGCTVTWAHHALLENDRDNTVRALTFTVLLGVLFTGLQAYEYSHATFGFRDGIYASTFYMATGFHGFHVLVGTIFLFVCLQRAHKGHFRPDAHVGFEAAAWYWHFVDVVWLFLFVAVYWWGG